MSGKTFIISVIKVDPKELQRKQSKFDRGEDCSTRSRESFSSCRADLETAECPENELWSVTDTQRDTIINE